jgi:hypothetical protein
MTKRLKFNLISWLMYTVIFYVVLIPFQIWFCAIPITIILGFFAGILNDIVIQLRKLNGEKFDNIE